MSGVLVITTSFPRFTGDAAGHFVEAEVRAALRSGEAVRVLAGGRPSGKPLQRPHPVQWLGADSLFQSPGAWPRLRERPWRVLSLSLALARVQRALARAEEEHVIVHWLVPFGLNVLLSRRLRSGRARCTLIAHGSDVRLLLRLPPLLTTRLLAAWARSGARLRLVSGELRDELASLPGLDAQTRRWLAASSIEPAAIEVEARTPANQLRARLGLSPTERCVVVLGRLIEGKRPEVALRAAALIPNATTLVIGDGPERARLEGEFPEARFLGELPRPEALDWLAAADLLLAASLTEGSPTAVREARALDVPVVCRRVGDLAEWAESDPQLWLLDAPGSARPNGTSHEWPHAQPREATR
ncbi:MAG TPA: glycosyltransferase [Polyangiaceae bacterium]|nr:glycosyltransferase [Polyangiaceae bacterium]